MFKVTVKLLWCFKDFTIFVQIWTLTENFSAWRVKLDEIAWDNRFFVFRFFSLKYDLFFYYVFFCLCYLVSQTPGVKNSNFLFKYMHVCIGNNYHELKEYYIIIVTFFFYTKTFFNFRNLCLACHTIINYREQIQEI